jgi:hypothetical protein
VNRTAERLGLVTDRSGRCPACREVFLEFKTDRSGRAFEQCAACGYRAYVERRSGKRDEPIKIVP